MEQEVFQKQLDAALAAARKNHNSITEEQLSQFFGDVAKDEKHRQILQAYFISKGIIIFGDDEEENMRRADKALEEEFSYDPKDKQYLDQYMEQLSEMEEISDQELERLLLRVGDHDRDAMGEVMRCYLRKAADLARTYAGQGIFMEDLIGEANLALTEAVMELDQYIDAQQSAETLLSDVESFLGERMMDAMEAMIREEMAVKDSDNQMAQKVNRVADAAASLSEELRRKVTVAELAENTDLTHEEIREVIRLLGNGKDGIDVVKEDEE
ncbi:MAG: hypothetical protein K6E84_06145 [Lachnospiraceae bacterium]|nr:hypothetical protein [Lachnospiraceae bacterium]